ncbi:glycosyltransferase family A protein [Rapidithrix thailandica]|uniref:Glycosyltransferase family A protein n=1 Tax=Rapidithrix thailandica TaxID=413964 RepID=A0AAW9S9T9_9BACT
MIHPLISVVVPTYQRNDLLRECLACLAPSVQSLDKKYYEVIVTDDGRQHTAEQMIKEEFSWVTWVQGPGKGPASNRNNGAKQAQGEWLAFTDDDCLPEHNWLESYYQAIQNHPETQAFEGAIHPVGEVEQDLTDCPVNLKGGCFWSANICVRKNLFEEIKGFDESYFLAAQEDQQLKIDVEEKAPIHFLPETIVKHPVRKVALWNTIKNVPKRSKNFALYAYKNFAVLGYRNWLNFTYKQYRFHLSSLYSNLSKGFYNNALISLVWLLYGVPLNCSNLLRFQKGGVTLQKQ